MLLLFSGITSVWAAAYTNPDTNYSAMIQDDAGLLSPEEEEALVKQMEPITAYGSVALVTIDHNVYYDASAYAEHFTDDHFSGSTGTVFLIDLDTRELYMDTTGSMRKRLTSAYANTIMDNVYSYASDGEYYICASKVFLQIDTLLAGGRIAQPMKYISNALLALVLALIINFILVCVFSKKHKPSASQLFSGIYSSFQVNHPEEKFTGQTKRYSPQSSGGGGHSGSGHSGGGHSGGGHSGGGHRF